MKIYIQNIEAYNGWIAYENGGGYALDMQAREWGNQSIKRECHTQNQNP